jgi:hypothetical protein
MFANGKKFAPRKKSYTGFRTVGDVNTSAAKKQAADHKAMIMANVQRTRAQKIAKGLIIAKPKK